MKMQGPKKSVTTMMCAGQVESALATPPAARCQTVIRIAVQETKRSRKQLMQSNPLSEIISLRHKCPSGKLDHERKVTEEAVHLIGATVR